VDSADSRPGSTTTASPNTTCASTPKPPATLEAALSPLAAPRPSQTDGPDLRNSDQRRADALLEIIRRGVKAARDVPVTTKAAIVVTIDLDRLREQTGTGTTTTGHQLPPAAVRQLACDADIIPTILGTHSEVLDLGRRRRLATPAQHRALWVRDHGCTYPGCTRPPTWCDAHHLTHWADGGPTDLDNLILLCARHHTLVHDRNLTATITGTGVTWHGIPDHGRGNPPRRIWPLAS
jgi:hypothetical protein